MALSRRKTRRCTLQYFFALWARQGNLTSPDFVGQFEDDTSIIDTKYLEASQVYIHDQLPRLLGIIQHYGPKFEVKSLPMVNLIILLIGLFELLSDALDDIPPHVAINESLELAKKYSDATSKNFINGILNSVLQDIDKIKDGSLEIKPIDWKVFE